VSGISEVKLDELYQEVILDHNRRPRNWGKLEHPSAYSHGHNPLCGDDYHLYVDVADGVIKELRFEGQGCAISKSSASMMTEAVSGKSKAAIEELKNNFIQMLTGAKTTEGQRKAVGNLKIFEGVKHFPIRVKCATLAWHALEDALKDIK
jgi:nitrogen fixation protein NifU and related proteins